MRARLRRLGASIARPYLPTSAGDWPARLRTVLRDPASWRDRAWLPVNSVVGGLVSFVLWYVSTRPLARLNA